MKKLHGRYLEVYGPYQVMLNVDGISIYTRTYGLSIYTRRADLFGRRGTQGPQDRP